MLILGTHLVCLKIISYAFLLPFDAPSVVVEGDLELVSCWSDESWSHQWEMNLVDWHPSFWMIFSFCRCFLVACPIWQGSSEEMVGGLVLWGELYLWVSMNYYESSPPTENLAVIRAVNMGLTSNCWTLPLFSFHTILSVRVCSQ